MKQDPFNVFGERMLPFYIRPDVKNIELSPEKDGYIVIPKEMLFKILSELYENLS